MDWTGLTAFLGAMTVFLPVLAKFWWDIRVNRLAAQKNAQDQVLADESFKHLWAGLYLRGTLEARQHDILRRTTTGEPWTLSPKAREVYQSLERSLQDVYDALKARTHAEPSDVELGWAIEQEFQRWMIETACPTLGISHLACVAIAVALVRQAKDAAKD